MYGSASFVFGFRCWVYYTAWFCLHAICKFIAAKSTSCYRLVLKKLTLFYVATLRIKLRLDILCAVRIGMLERWCMPICLSVLILQIMLMFLQEMCEKCAYPIDANIFPMWAQVPNSYLPKLLPFYLHSASRETLQHWEHRHDVKCQAQQLLDFCAVLLILYWFSKFSLWLIGGCCKKSNLYQ